MRYRPDIDGLRALSIIAVVGCHVGVPGFAGGFVGVDAFFVISGFLITTLLREEHAASGRINLPAFYARRVRRLAPAMALVLIATLAAGFFLLSPDGEQQGLAVSAGAVSTFVSNYYFGLTRLGYFISSSEFLPLLHTWSLGIEEQFYIVWPALMIVSATLARRFRSSTHRFIVPALALGTAASLALCFVMLEISQSFAFYGFPTRAWELAAGALLAYAPWPQKPKPLVGALVTVAGVVAIVTVVTTHRPQNMFTALPSVIAVVAAVLIIAGGSLSDKSILSRLLAMRPMVAIGKLSYSWYLWHWPLLSLARIQALGEDSLVRDLGVAVISLALAALTWRFIEQPARQQKFRIFSNDRRSLVAGAVILGLCAALAACLWAWGQHQLGNSPAAQLAAQAGRNRIMLSEPCENAVTIAGLLSGKCIRGGQGDKPLVLVLGDSHARHLVPGLAELSEAANVRILPAVKSGCLAPPLPKGHWRGVIERRQLRCATFTTTIVRGAPALKESHGLKGVIISGKWERNGNWQATLPSYVRYLRAQGLRVALVLDVPAYAYSAPRCYAHRGSAEECGSSRAEVERARAGDLAVIQAIASQDSGVKIWDPLDALCSETRCEILLDGEILYSDAHHLSYAGSRRVTASIAPMLTWVTGQEPR